MSEPDERRQHPDHAGLAKPAHARGRAGRASSPEPLQLPLLYTTRQDMVSFPRGVNAMSERASPMPMDSAVSHLENGVFLDSDPDCEGFADIQ
jgi:hypothetical protein